MATHDAAPRRRPLALIAVVELVFESLLGLTSYHVRASAISLSNPVERAPTYALRAATHAAGCNAARHPTLIRLQFIIPHMGQHGSKPPKRLDCEMAFLDTEVVALRSFFANMTGGAKLTATFENLVNAFGMFSADFVRLLWDDWLSGSEHAVHTMDYETFALGMARATGRREVATGLTGPHDHVLARILSAYLVSLHNPGDAELSGRAAEQVLTRILSHAFQLSISHAPSHEPPSTDELEQVGVFATHVVTSLLAADRRQSLRVLLGEWLAVSLPMAVRNTFQYMAETIGLIVGSVQEKQRPFYPMPELDASGIGLQRLDVWLLSAGVGLSHALLLSEEAERASEAAGAAESAGASSIAYETELQTAVWTVLFDSRHLGRSLLALLDAVDKYDAPMVLLVTTDHEAVFGAYITTPIVKRLAASPFDGSPDMFLFSLRPQLEVCSWAHHHGRENFIHVDERGIVFGGRDGHHRLTIDADLVAGSATAEDATYRPGSIAPASFNVQSLVILGLGGHEAVRRKAHHGARKAHYVIQRRMIDRKALGMTSEDWASNPDREILEMAGSYQSYAHEARKEPVDESKVAARRA